MILKDANKVAFWDDNGTIYYSTWKVGYSTSLIYADNSRFYSNLRHTGFQASAAELKQLTAVFGDRDSAIKQGLVAGGVRYEVKYISGLP